MGPLTDLANFFLERIVYGWRSRSILANIIMILAFLVVFVFTAAALLMTVQTHL